MTIDLALVEKPDGTLIFHHAYCPAARRAVRKGWPVFTMIDCRAMPELGRHQLHSCLDRYRDLNRADRRN